MNERGSASVAALVILVSLSLLFLAAGLGLQAAARGLARAEERQRERERLLGLADWVVERLAEDPTPEADSPFDPVWERIRRPPEEGISIELEDVSSRLGVNWIQGDLVDRLEALPETRTVLEFLEFREAAGLQRNLESFAEFFPEPEDRALLTPWSWFNIHLSDPTVVVRLYRGYGADAQAAEALLARLRVLQRGGQTLDSRTLPAFLGEADYRLLFPLVNAEPLLNVHFLPERLLQILAGYLRISPGRADQILALRAEREMLPAELWGRLGGGSRPSRARQLLGTRSWFWEIRLAGDHQELTRVVARLPAEVVSFRIVEEGLRP